MADNGGDGRRGKDGLSPAVHYRLAKFSATFSAVFLTILPFFLVDLIVPITVDSKPEWNTLCLFRASPFINNVILVAIFALQHSVMARAQWKRFVLNYFPAGFEKSLYSLATGAVLIIIYLFWMPVTDVWFWRFENTWLYYGTVVVNLVMWRQMMQTVSSLKEFDIFGVQVAEDRYNKKEADSQKAGPPKILKRGLFRYIRHPTMTFQLLAHWIVPTMSLGHFIWASGMSVYIFIAVVFFEEPDLIKEFGEDYKTYMKEVPRFVPNPFKILKDDS